MKKLTLTLAAVAAASAFALAPAKAQIIITEVDPTGSSTSTYAADWWEITNEGSSSVSLSGWKMDDSHDSTSAALALNGVSSINPGQSVVFIESTGQTVSTVETNFEDAWFGSTANVPAGFTIGTYSGSNVGLSSSGDAVNLYNSSNVLQAGVAFGTATSNVTFDNSVLQASGTTGTGSGDPTISTLSVVGVNGAFKNAGNEIGSPGAVPEPSSGSLAAIVALVFAGCLAVRRNFVRA